MLFGKLSQKGFATLEVILMITVLGILSAVAIPRFSAITTSANTAKVQADLSTLDTAIALYQMDNGKVPTKISELKDYVQDVNNIKPPSGKVYVKGEEKDLSSESYSIIDTETNPRAALGEHTSEEFTKINSSSGNSGSSGNESSNG